MYYNIMVRENGGKVKEFAWNGELGEGWRMFKFVTVIDKSCDFSYYIRDKQLPVRFRTIVFIQDTGDVALKNFRKVWNACYFDVFLR
jgi:hypothetical protein